MSEGSPAANAPQFPFAHSGAPEIRLDGLQDGFVERRHGRTVRSGFSHSRRRPPEAERAAGFVAMRS